MSNLNSAKKSYDAILVVSFGGPEGPDDVMPFLENVLRGKNVPHERMLEVAEHYNHFGGISPINQQCRELIAALKSELAANQIDLPVYWGNRNWTPMLPDTIAEMKRDGVGHALCFFTSLYSCYSGCRQYRENLFDACAAVGDGCPAMDKIRMPYNHPLLIAIQADALTAELNRIPEPARGDAKVLFCAHSIPDAMADNCRYQEQLTETARLTAEAVGHANWELVFQSRSGPPTQPWLEPDVCDRISDLHNAGELENVVLHPIGFISDHMEVLFDLDHEAKELCDAIGIGFYRAATASSDPRFVKMIRELIVERMNPGVERPAVGKFPANHDVCPANCCQSGRPGAPPRPAMAQANAT